MPLIICSEGHMVHLLEALMFVILNSEVVSVIQKLIGYYFIGEGLLSYFSKALACFWSEVSVFKSYGCRVIW